MLGKTFKYNFERVEASSEDIRNDWVEEINAAIEMGKGRNFDSPPPDPEQLSAEKDLPTVDEELPGDLEPVSYPDGLADFCQVSDSIQWILLAPSGALIVMMCFYWSTYFFRF